MLCNDFHSHTDITNLDKDAQPSNFLGNIESLIGCALVSQNFILLKL